MVKQSVFDKLDVIEANNEQQEFSADLEEMKEEVSAIDDILGTVSYKLTKLYENWDKRIWNNTDKKFLEDIVAIGKKLNEAKERLY